MTSDTIIQIPLEHLHESPFNPRKTFTAIDELVANIKGEGRIHSPLLVRPIIPPLFDAGADTQPEAVAGYELVFGHRRYRAAQMAGLATAPCMVRAMTDAEARSAQIAENLARKDVHPIEEAEGFKAMLQQDGITADELAALVGQSRSYVYGRLKLLQAVPQVRDACLRGEIDAEAALLVARVGLAKLQEKALARIKAINVSLGDGGKASYRRIKAELADSFTLQLKGAIFDREDAQLLPGAGTCSACPKRTGNSPVFEDVATEGVNTSRWEHSSLNNVGEPNRCTDPDCWDAKTKAHLAAGAARLEAEGKLVVTGNKARQALDAAGTPRNGYLPLERVKAELKKAAKPVPVVHVQDQRTGKVVKAVRREDLVAAGLAKPEPKAAEKGSKGESNEARQKRHEAEYQAKREKAAADTEANRRLLLTVRGTAASRERTGFELRLLAAAALASTSYDVWPTLTWLYDSDMESLKRRVDTMSADELTQLLLDCAIVDHVETRAGWDEKPEPLLALAQHYGIDALAAMQAPAQPPTEGTSTPSTAGARAKHAAPKGVAYHCAETGESWSGRGLRPAWLRAKIAGGASLSDFAVAKKAKPEANSKTKGKKVNDDAGFAGGQGATTAGLFEADEVHA
jgi:ParB/RepB/Spo0J family partition protein